MEKGPAATTRGQRRSVDRGSANSQIAAYTEGELRSNPGGARERYFVLSVAAAAGQLGCAKGVNLACGVAARHAERVGRIHATKASRCGIPDGRGRAGWSVRNRKHRFPGIYPLRLRG